MFRSVLPVTWYRTREDERQRACACCLFTCRQRPSDPGFATRANTDSEKSLMETITALPIKRKQTVEGAHLEAQVCVMHSFMYSRHFKYTLTRTDAHTLGT